MKRDPYTPAHISLPPEQVEFALARIEHSASFRGTARHQALLRHLVSRVLGGEHLSLKESVIAVEVFGRAAASFDPQRDSIVRVEARRLRARLARYYRTDGRDAPIRIELPVGSYVPLIANREPATSQAAATRHARDLMERGEHYLHQPLTRESLEAALARFDECVRESPTYVPAYVGMGRAWLNLATGWYRDPKVASEHAAEALRQAITLDPDHAVAHVLLGAIQHQFERDWPAAQRNFKRALALAPKQAFVHSAYGSHLIIHGALDDAERELLQARELDPLYINTRSHMVNLRLAQGRLGDAQAELFAIRDISPTTMPIAGLLGAIAMFRRDPEAAVRHYSHACELSPEHGACFIALAGAHAMAGRTDMADALLAETLQRFDPRSISPYVLAIFETRQGRSGAAFALLERAQDECDPSAMQIVVDPSFEGLRSDPRWQAMIRRTHKRLRD